MPLQARTLCDFKENYRIRSIFNFSWLAFMTWNWPLQGSRGGRGHSLCLPVSMFHIVSWVLPCIASNGTCAFIDDWKGMGDRVHPHSLPSIILMSTLPGWRCYQKASAIPVCSWVVETRRRWHHWRETEKQTLETWLQTAQIWINLQPTNGQSPAMYGSSKRLLFLIAGDSCLNKKLHCSWRRGHHTLVSP